MLRQFENIWPNTHIFGQDNACRMLTVFVARPCPQHNGAPIIVPGPDILFI